MSDKIYLWSLQTVNISEINFYENQLTSDTNSFRLKLYFEQFTRPHFKMVEFYREKVKVLESCEHISTHTTLQFVGLIKSLNFVVFRESIPIVTC